MKIKDIDLELVVGPIVATLCLGAIILYGVMNYKEQTLANEKLLEDTKNKIEREVDFYLEHENPAIGDTINLEYRDFMIQQAYHYMSRW